MFLQRSGIRQSRATGKRVGGHVTWDSSQVIHLAKTAAAVACFLCLKCCAFKDLISILALQEGSSWQVLSDPLSTSSWDQIIFYLRNQHQGKGNGLLQSSLDKHRVKMFCATFIKTAKEGQREPIYRRQLL